ncbi:calcium-binding mitochondrial carrier protein SCaMC-2-B-like [Adelges cooleyi]|uniref:calcium-binding mitochondrial carrier protein SCaMC-2-B-like n=1 Tax=Adelges cooleyi TaxID=133065 RepID=UPI0021808450|nr:calcium-binding mitochondrial carrier protein SCaMC-2-B-like [Adelges cooleyi]
MVGKYSGTSEVISTTWKKEGLTGFFKGYVPHTLGMLVFTGIDLTIYEMSKNRLNGERLQWSVNMASAICSSTVAHCTCYPISMLTTKFQANNQPDAKFMDLVKHNWKTSGALGMYRGFLAALVKMLPGMTISYVAYEELCSSFGVRM